MDNAVDGGILLLIGWERMKPLKARPGVFMIQQIVIPGPVKMKRNHSQMFR